MSRRYAILVFVAALSTVPCTAVADVVDDIVAYIDANDDYLNLCATMTIEKKLLNAGAKRKVLEDLLVGTGKAKTYDFTFLTGRKVLAQELYRKLGNDQLLVAHLHDRGVRPTWYTYRDKGAHFRTTWFSATGREHYLLRLSDKSYNPETGINHLKIDVADRARFEYKLVKELPRHRYLLRAVPKDPKGTNFIEALVTIQEYAVRRQGRPDTKGYVPLKVEARFKGDRDQIFTSVRTLSDFRLAEAVPPQPQGTNEYDSIVVRGTGPRTVRFAAEAYDVTKNPGVDLTRPGTRAFLYPFRVQSQTEGELLGQRYTIAMDVSITDLRLNAPDRYLLGRLRPRGKAQPFENVLGKIQTLHADAKVLAGAGGD